MIPKTDAKILEAKDFSRNNSLQKVI